MTERYNAAKNLGVYLNKENYYIHLMDGGLSDNIGARSILDAFDRGFIRTRINREVIRQMVLTVVNARIQGEDEISRKQKPPGFFTVVEKTATVALDNYSYDTFRREPSLLPGYADLIQAEQGACGPIRRKGPKK